MAKKIVFKLQISGPDLSKEVTLNIGETTIGREPANDIQLNFPKISRRHARIECTETMSIIIDQDSANGTLVNGERISPNVPVPLNDKSVIEIDPVRMICSHIITEEKEKTAKKQPQKTIALDKVEKAEEEKPEKKEEVPPKKKEAKPPKPPKKPPPKKVRPPEPEPEPEPKEEPFFPPGLSERSIRYINFLPGIYQGEFMERFMALFESMLIPIEWNVDNFDLFLKADTSPTSFLPWLSYWFDITFDSSWPEAKRRQLLNEAHMIYARRGTRWALTRLLEIYTDQTPDIIEFEDDMDAHTFRIILKKDKSVDEDLVTRLIDVNKPAHTSYQLEFKK